MRKMIVTIGILTLFLLSSCATLNEFPIEVFQPARINLPPHIKSIALVSRNLKYKNDTLRNYYSRNYKLTKDIGPQNIDSIAIKACFDSLSRKIEDQNRFSKVTVLPYATLPVKFSGNINPPAKSLIQKISSDTQADAIVLLDMFSGFYSLYPAEDESKSIAQVVTASIWTIYNPSTYRILHHTTMVDTLYWDGLGENGDYLASRIPNKKAAMEIAAGLAGVKYSKNLVPYWRQVARQILSCNQVDFKKASRLANKNEWEQASAIWDSYTNSSNKRYRIQALYNLAVASEMEGNIVDALQLLSDASAISSSAVHSLEMKSIRKYAAILEKRKVELNKINSTGYEE